MTRTNAVIPQRQTIVKTKVQNFLIFSFLSSLQETANWF